MNWYLSVLKNYAVFEGRARRKEYWMFFLVNILISIAFQVVDGVLGTVFLGIIYSLAVFVPSLAVGVRRLHDVDKSGWWLLLVLIPVVGVLVLIYFAATEGTQGSNQYGSSPK